MRNLLVRGTVALGILLCGCASEPRPEVREYLIQAPLSTTGLVQNAPRLHITQVEVAPHIKGITLVRGSGRVDTLVLHRFAAPVPRLIEERLRADLLATGKFEAVLSPRSRAQATLALEVSVPRFELHEPAAGALEAQAALEATLFDMQTGRFLWSGRALGTSTATADEVPALVDALARALEQVSRTCVRELSESIPMPGH